MCPQLQGCKSALLPPVGWLIIILGFPSAWNDSFGDFFAWLTPNGAPSDPLAPFFSWTGLVVSFILQCFGAPYSIFPLPGPQTLAQPMTMAMWVLNFIPIIYNLVFTVIDSEHAAAKWNYYWGLIVCSAVGLALEGMGIATGVEQINDPTKQYDAYHDVPNFMGPLSSIMKPLQYIKGEPGIPAIAVLCATDFRIDAIWAPTPAELNGGRMPNILWICTDMQRFDTIEGLNNDVIRTPNLRKLMSESVTLTHTYVQNPVCSPSRACMLTGRYPHTTGLRALGQRIRPSEKLVTKTLSDAGYACGLSGKLHLSPTFGGRLEERIDDGYSVFDWSHDISNLWPGHNMWRVWLKEQGVKWPTPPEGKDSLVWGVPIDPKYTQTAWCSDRAIQFIHGQKDFTPWLMSVNIYQPHAPYWPTEEYLDHYRASDIPAPNYREGELRNKPIYQQVDHHGASGGKGISFDNTSDLDRRRVKAAYYAMIEQVDTEVGRMLKALEDTGQAENTIVIFMSDHGEMLGDHGIFLKGPYFYEGAIRVPMIIRWPGRYKAGLRSDALVEMVDLAPTLLEAAGLPPTVGMQGRSFTRLLTGQTTKHRDSIYCEYFDSLALYDPPPMALCVRTEQHKAAYYQNLSVGELYDLEKDPNETNNLWDVPNARSTREMMMQLMISRMVDTVDPLPDRKCIW